MKHLIVKTLALPINSLIWLWNLMAYASHVETYRNNGGRYEPYDFSKDVRYIGLKENK